MTSDDRAPSRMQIRCNFVILRGVDPVFRRTVYLVDVPRVGERVHMWFEAGANIRGTVRDVQWTIPEDGSSIANIQIELSPGDRRRHARRPPLDDPETAG